MEETGQLLDLIGGIYDTVLDRALWPQVLKKASLFVGGAGSSVFWSDAASYRGDVFFEDDGVPPYYRDLYFSKYAKLNPCTVARFFAEPEEPIATADLVPYDEFLRTRFYREWAQPQGLVDYVSIILEKSATKAAMFGVFRHERDGVVDEAARQRMRLLAPHIRRAVLISKVIDLKQGEADMLAQAVDGLRAAMILADANGRIVHANAAGHALIAEGDVIRAVEGRLAAATRQADESLRDAFIAAAFGDEAIGGRGIALPVVATSGDRYAIHVLPLTSGARRRTGRTHAATAAIFVHKAALEVPSPPVAIAEAYKLTMAELRVLFAIIETGSVPEAAEMLGIAASTVKTHLGRVFEKTGTAGQTGLVKLVAGFSNPLFS
jgi:DNA-binding CsgD family transcriptional regulator/PAS domain-containing protein